VLNKLVGAEFALELDAELMLRVRAGDTAGFDQLLAKYRGPIVGYLTRMVRNHAVAEELAQEVFLRVYKARGSYEPTAKFTTWLYRIATRVALNSIRDSKAHSSDRSLQDSTGSGRPLQPADTRPNREQELVADARLIAVRHAIAALPDNQRAAVLMHKYQELDYTQIAAALGCSVSAVKSLLFRAYGTLRSRLEEVFRNNNSQQPQVTR
jgi:RNA polymerase sigma-70 factor (ECF subfamily)